MNREHLWLAVSMMGPKFSDAVMHYICAGADLETFCASSPEEMARLAGLPISFAKTFVTKLHGKNLAARELAEKLGEIEGYFISFEDSRYPLLLKDLPNPPAVLYVKGSLSGHEKKAVAVVGARNADAYGLEVALTVSCDLARQDVLVVSGFARGIDSAAHRGALKGGGRTVAVKGCGLDIRYPTSNDKLAEYIVRNGALISEYPLGTEPVKWNFPRRNRIIAAMSMATVVVQADVKSGSLLTASDALSCGRDVMAVPGNIFNPLSRGTHALLKAGAPPVECAADIIGLLGWESSSLKATGKAVALTKPEKHILRFVNGSCNAVQISDLCSLPVSEVFSTLLQLELKGVIKRVGGDFYIKL